MNEEFNPFTKFQVTEENKTGFSAEPVEFITEYMSYSRIKEMDKSMKHFKVRYIDGVIPEDTDQKAFGRTVHAALLEPQKFRDRYVIRPKKENYEDLLDTADKMKAELKKHKKKIPAGAKKADLEGLLVQINKLYRTKIWSAIVEDFEKNLKEDAMIITDPQADLILAMIKEIEEKRIYVGQKMYHARTFFSGGFPEVCAYWYDEEYNVTWFIRIDYIRFFKTPHGWKAWISDLKTTHDASKEGFEREKAKLGYHFQEWIYKRVVKGITGLPVNFTQFAIENTDPKYIGCNIHESTLRSQDTAGWQIRRYLEKWRECLALNRWPKYPEEIIQSGLPNYVYYRIEESAEEE